MFQDIEGAKRELGQALGATLERFEEKAHRESLLAAALGDLSRDRPRVLRDELQLTPDLSTYEAPEDFAGLSVHDWGRPEVPQWDAQFAGPMPRITSRYDGETHWIEFQPAPSHRQVLAWGSVFKFRYRALHRLDEDGTTLAPADRDLLILRAVAEAMQRMAASGVVQPVQVHRGMGASLPANGTPAALAEQLMQEYRHRARGTEPRGGGAA